MLETMYLAAVNSRQTELATAIDDTQTSFTVLDGSVLPPAPNLLTLGTDESAETVLYTGKTGNEVTGITRGFESGAVSWAAGTKLARFFTAYDHDTFRENIADLDQRLSDIVIPPASLTEQGIVMLSKSTTGNRDNVAATESAVAAAFQYGVERKAEVVAALNSIGVAATTSETWAQLIPKISGVIRATGNATAADLLTGKTASNVSGPITGTMANRGAVSQNITTQNGSYTVPAGYHNGLGVIRAVFSNLIAANIREGINIGGVVGNFAEGPKYATGLATTGTQGVDFISLILASGSTSAAPYVTVSGLTFKPVRVVIEVVTQPDTAINATAFPSSSNLYNGYQVYLVGGQTNAAVRIDGSVSYINDTGFRLGVRDYARQYRWHAYG